MFFFYFLKFFIPVVTPEGASTVTHKWAFPRLQRHDEQNPNPGPNKVRILASNPTSESNQRNPQIWNQSPRTHLLDSCVDLRGLDRCKEDKGNPARNIRVQRAEVGVEGGRTDDDALLKPAQYPRWSTHVALTDESKRVREGLRNIWWHLLAR